MYWHKTPQIIQWLYPNCTWHKSRDYKSIYLTFDDGPIPEVTPQVLSILNKYDVKATFFCVGDNVRKNPDVYGQVISNGHKVGNHTFDHINGWKHTNEKYINSVNRCKEIMPEATFFRPAYGKAKRKSLNVISKNYEIVMWDVLAGDFDPTLSENDCLQNTIKATRNGSIVIFHDSLKAQKNMLYTLPLYIEHFKNKGYKFKLL